uniref:Uncharacterized protein n=1 Tax=Anguilla anguilla TaxID=7936 RepID=A0A0E9VYQ7_ANGAN
MCLMLFPWSVALPAIE